MSDRQARWAEIEASLDRSDRLEYCRSWGAAREAFFKEVGPIPISDGDRASIRGLRNRYRGNRIFIIGNGPSINKMPLHLLSDEFTFGVNRIYLLYDRITWRPTFYTANDWRVVPDVADEINALTGSTFFFDQRFRGLLREGPDVFFYEHASAPKGASGADLVFSYDLSVGARGAGSVVGSAIQIAHYLGFDEIYLIGCDLGYQVTDTVVQEGEDRFGNGVKLHLTSTKDDDRNHFDPRYFGAGRRWHDPNVKRMVEGHEQCRIGVEAAGGKIFNATLGGALEVYPRVDFLEVVQEKKGRQSTPDRILFSAERRIAGPWAKDDLLNVNEAVLAKSLCDRLGVMQPGVMVDVGAHHGSSLLPFANDGWKVIAYEPDPKNRGVLERNLAREGLADSVTIRPVAVSDSPQCDVPYYASAESSGVSGLSAFLATHHEVERVNITTLDSDLAALGVEWVDYLKIDVEGFELFALDGFPWSRITPSVCLVEFEDEKTVVQGYNTASMAKFLEERGYRVFVLEWHPITAYGVDHSFKRFYPYDEGSLATECWGNLLAVHDSELLTFDSDALLAALVDGIIQGQRDRAAKVAARGQAGRKPPATAEKKNSSEITASVGAKAAPTEKAQLNANASEDRLSEKKEPSQPPAGKSTAVPRPSSLKPAPFNDKVFEELLPAPMTSLRFSVSLRLNARPEMPAGGDGYSPTYPEMPFVFGHFAAYVLAGGVLRVNFGKHQIVSASLEVGQDVAIEGVHEPDGAWALWIDGELAASGDGPIAESERRLRLGAGFLKRRFISGVVTGIALEVEHRLARTVRLPRN